MPITEYSLNGLDIQVTPTNPLPVSTDGVSDGTLTSPWDGTAVACAGFGNALISFNGITGGDSYAIKGSLAGVTYKTLSAVNLSDNSTPTTITADGIYSFPALGFITFTKTGVASTPTVNLLLKR